MGDLEISCGPKSSVLEWNKPTAWIITQKYIEWQCKWPEISVSLCIHDDNPSHINEDINPDYRDGFQLKQFSTVVVFDPQLFLSKRQANLFLIGKNRQIAFLPLVLTRFYDQLLRNQFVQS